MSLKRSAAIATRLHDASCPHGRTASSCPVCLQEAEDAYDHEQELLARENALAVRAADLADREQMLGEIEEREERLDTRARYLIVMEDELQSWATELAAKETELTQEQQDRPRLRGLFRRRDS